MDTPPIMIKPRSRIRFDLFIIATFNILAFLLFAEVDALEWLYNFSQAHEDAELDEIVVLFFTLSLSLGVFAFRRWQEGNALIAHVHELATKDPLTGAYNRRYMDHILEHEVERSKRSQHSFSLLMLDADFFKKVNDTYGHHIGDHVLTQLYNIINTNTRGIDITARWGGEEFLILCPNTNAEAAKVIGLKLLKAVQDSEFKKIGHITVSIGVATFHSRETVMQLINRADACLYHAKEHGRNQIKSDIIP